MPTTPADVEALRRARRARCLSTEDYLRALAQLPAPPPEVHAARLRLRARQPFRLD